VVTFMPAGPLLEFNPEKVKAGAQHPAGAARLVQGQTQSLLYAAPRTRGRARHVINGPWPFITPATRTRRTR